MIIGSSQLSSKWSSKTRDQGRKIEDWRWFPQKNLGRHLQETLIATIGTTMRVAQYQTGLKEDDYLQGFLGFKLRIYRISAATGQYSPEYFCLNQENNSAYGLHWLETVLMAYQSMTWDWRPEQWPGHTGSHDFWPSASCVTSMGTQCWAPS